MTPQGFRSKEVNMATYDSSPFPNLAAYYRVPSVSWKLPTLKPISVQGAKNFQEGVREVIEAWQQNLEPGEQLLVYYTNGVEMIRVGHVCLSSTNLAVISGSDQEGKATQVVAHFHALQFVCKVVRADESKEKTKVEFSIA
jgi:hypothetical protein